MNTLETAGKIYAERQQQYGDPQPVYERIAKMWSAALGVTISARQVVHCMILLKLGRECERHKDDNLVDIGGYLACLDNMTPDSPLVGLRASAYEEMKKALNPLSGGTIK